MGMNQGISGGVTRYTALRDCPRKFFYKYYWRYEIEAIASAANGLNKLNTPASIAGQVVEWTISKGLCHYRDNGVMEPVNDLVARGVTEYDRIVALSPINCKRVKRRSQPPDSSDGELERQFKPLHHEYYGYTPKFNTTQDGRDKVVKALRNFYHSEVLEKILELGPENWGFGPHDDRTWLAFPLDKSKRPKGSFSTVPSFMLGDLPIWGKYDFILKEQPLLHILDWKVRESNPDYKDDVDRQLSIYALWAASCEDLKWPPENIRVQEVCLLDAEILWNPIAISEDTITMAKNYLLENHEKEKSMVDYREVNHVANNKDGMFYCADIKDFEPLVGNQCYRCNFIDLCREGYDFINHTTTAEAEKAREEEWNPFADE